MENEYGKYGTEIYRKLLYFYQNKIPVHFTLSGSGKFFNGIILELNEKKLTLILDDFKIHEVPFLLEEINSESIVKYNER